MLAVVIFGAYSLYFQSPGAKPKGSAAPQSNLSLDSFVAEIAQSLSGLDLSGPSGYVMTQAETPWERDPFLESELRPANQKEDVAAETTNINSILTYSGYLKMGNRGLAIINGMEYEMGEVLDETGYIVKNITPTQVVVGMSGRKKDFVLLLTETE